MSNLGQLIDHLTNIQNTYGDLPVMFWSEDNYFPYPVGSLPLVIEVQDGTVWIRAHQEGVIYNDDLSE